MKSCKKIAFVCCSNAQPRTSAAQHEELCLFLHAHGIETVCSPCLYTVPGTIAPADAPTRAAVLMRFFRDASVDAIFDLSGGDIANEILDFLDYPAIAASHAVFFGYSDLTTVINAIFAQTGRPSVLYQGMNLVLSAADIQKKRLESCLNGGVEALFSYTFHFLRGRHMEGILIGGNTRCLLKLAGTPYFPDMRGKILFLEALGCTEASLTAYFSQLRQIGVFRQVSGVLLGTFTQMERENTRPTAEELLFRFLPETLPVAKTGEIGHAPDAKALPIGRPAVLHESI